MNDYIISTDKDKLDLSMIHRFLSEESYWAKNIPYEIVEKSVRHSLCFGVYKNAAQVGYARVITDYSTIAYLGDVFILKEHRGKGLSKQLMETIRQHPDLQGLRRWILLTSDAHALYQSFGWTPIAHPEKWMEIHRSDPYG